MIELILESAYLMLPAYLANMTPVFFRRVNFLNYPLDFGATLDGKPLLGNSKTFRGIFFGTLAAVFLAFIQYLLAPSMFDSPGINYAYWPAIGLLLGFGALFGDAVKSFFKRRLGIKPGQRFLPWDQLDYSIGALLFLSLTYLPSWQIIVTAIITGFFLHIIANHIGFYLKIRREKW